MEISKTIKQLLTSVLMITLLVVSGTQAAQTTQSGKATGKSEPPQNVQSVVAKQASLVSEFDINGLKVLMKRREGSLTVAAGLFIRGGASNINSTNAGIETLMLSASTEATAGFPRETMRSALSRMYRDWQQFK